MTTKSRLNGTHAEPNPAQSWKRADGRVAAVYVYQDAEGNPLFERVTIQSPADLTNPDPESRTFARNFSPDDPRADADGYVDGQSGHRAPPYKLPSILKAAEIGEPVFVCPSEGIADVLEACGLYATHLPRTWTLTDAELLRSTHAVVLMLPDKQEEPEAIAQVLLRASVIVTVLDMATIPGLRAPDLVSSEALAVAFESGTVDPVDLAHAASTAARYQLPEGEPKGPPNATQWLIDRLLADTSLCYTEDRDVYLRFDLNGAYQTAKLKGDAATDFMQHLYYGEHGRTVRSDAIKETKDQLASLARLQGILVAPAVRVIRHNDCIYIDLGDDSWHAIEIKDFGWRIVERPPVVFIRPAGMNPLPRPVHVDGEEGITAARSALLRFFSLSDEDDLPLLIAVLAIAFSPEGDYPHVFVCGGEGSGKSTATRLIRDLVDPNRTPHRAAPKTERDLIIAARNAHMLSFDNLSRITPSFSDQLCRLSTGAGFGTRKLRTDAEESLVHLSRLVITNSIDEVITKADLLSRTVVLHMTPPTVRRDRDTINADLAAMHPRILGLLLDGVALADGTPSGPADRERGRLPLFERWGEVMAIPFQLKRRDFAEALRRNRSQGMSTLAHSNETVRLILAYMETRTAWQGTADELRKQLVSSNGEVRPVGFPTNARAMMNELRRVATLLRSQGVQYSRPEQRGHNNVQIHRLERLNL